MARRWFSGRWTPYLIGALAGLLVAMSCALYWQRADTQPSITLIGSGNGLSALVTTRNTRLLIIAGDDPIAFANAFADARPPTRRRIDLIVVAPGSGPARVAVEALTLSNPQRIMAIDSLAEPESVFQQVDSIRLIATPRTIELDGEMLIAVDPGMVAGLPTPGWSVTITTSTAAVLLSESTPHRTSPEIGLVVIMGNRLGSMAHLPTTAIAASSTAEEQFTIAHQVAGRIAPGEAKHIPLGPNGVQVPADWVIRHEPD